MNWQEFGSIEYNAVNKVGIWDTLFCHHVVHSNFDSFMKATYGLFVHLVVLIIRFLWYMNTFTITASLLTVMYCPMREHLVYDETCKTRLDDS